MPRNLIICCDGTSNEFGRENTNVVRLIQVLDRDPGKQRLYYDPGVGTLPEPGWVTWAGKKISDVAGLAFGAGLSWKVEEAYTYLMDIWEPGDQVFLFGFSRGAYTARVLAGMLHALGLLPRGAHNMVPYAMRLFKAIRKEPKPKDRSKGKRSYWDLCNEFRWTFSRTVYPGDHDRRFGVHFLGVWDTVSFVGWVWNPQTFQFTAHNPSIDVIRHAVSIDERRWFFRQNLVKPVDQQDVKEYWFPGVHCDVGGGYSENESGLWRGSFEWIVDEAKAAGLLINPQRLQTVLSKSPVSAHPWNDLQHESLTGLWWAAEYFPKWHWRSDLNKSVLRIGKGQHRIIPSGEMIQKWALLRIRETSYAPPNLTPEFLEMVRALDIVPEALPYSPDGNATQGVVIQPSSPSS
jgi:uncharacterized protein (DUF2235 family)